MTKSTENWPTPRRLVVHVGPHKTASSYIQVNLTQLRMELAARGWLYPGSVSGQLDAHHHIAHNREQHLDPNSEQYRELESIGQQASSDNQSIVLSAEGFCRWGADDLVSLGAILGFDQIEVVYVVRDPLDVFPSYWAEEVKQGMVRGFTEKLALGYAAIDESNILNPLCDLAPLLAHPSIKVHAVPFDALRRHDVDIFNNFAKSVLKLPDVQAIHNRPVNRKYSVELTEFLRLMTLIHGDGAARIGSSMRLEFMSLTTQEELRAFAQLLREKGANARRVVKVSASNKVNKDVERALMEDLKGHWTLDMANETRLFSQEERRFPYYSEYILSQTPDVMNAAREALARLGI